MGEGDALEGRFKDKLGWWKVERFGVAGKVGRALSSLLGGRLKSPVDGCVSGLVVGLDASDRERDLGERDTGSFMEDDSGCNCWLNLLSKGWAVALRSSPGGRV